MIFALAEKLRCQVSEIEAMPSREFAEWWAYLAIVAREKQQAEQSARLKR